MTTQEMIGKILTRETERDAIHIAVFPATAGHELEPGQHVGLKDGRATGLKPLLGIVDPFLKGTVPAGAHFWLFLYPNTVTGMRHHWSLAAFDGHPGQPVASTSIEASEKWLRDFIASADCPSYEVVMAAAVGEHKKNADPSNDPDGYPNYYNSQNDGEYLHFGGRDAHGDIPPEFWDHVEVVSGQKIPSGWRARHFSCSC